MTHQSSPTVTAQVVRRVWRVEVVPESGRMHCLVPFCPGAPGRAARAAVLAHLAAHARGEPLADHLRTCRCRAHGCRWHPRTRGCAGMVRLVLFRQRLGKVWQLADVCTGCAQMIPEAAEVPAAAVPVPPRPGRHPGAPPSPRPADSPTPCGSSLAAVLHYLGAALPGDVSAGAVLLALVCLSRSDRTGTALLPTGLLRSLRLGHRSDDLLHELARGRWLCPERSPLGHWPEPPGGGWKVRLTDRVTGLGRRTRRHLLGQVMEQLTHPTVRVLDDRARLQVLRAAAAPAGTALPGAAPLDNREGSC